MTSFLATALVGGLVGSGALLNKDGRQPREQEDVRKSIAADEQPNSRNTYHSERYYDSWNTEFANATRAHLKAQDPVNENVVPLYYNQMSLRQQSSPQMLSYEEKRTKRLQGQQADRSGTGNMSGAFINEGRGGNEVPIQDSPMFNPLGVGNMGSINPDTPGVENFEVANRSSGNPNSNLVTREEHFGNYTVSGPANSNNPMEHNNMVPFFGSRVTQNTDPEANMTLLQNYTGQTNDITEFRSQPHREIPSLQDRTPGQSFIYGMPADLTADTKNRYITSNFKQNVTPFQQIRVGPGIAPDTYEAAPRDGFHSYYRPAQRNVDDLRVNPKNTYRGRTLAGKQRVQNRGFSGDVFKNRPDTFSVNDQRRWNKTTGAFTAPRIRENFEVDLNCQNRSSTNVSYVGAAGTQSIQQNRPGVYLEGSPADNGGSCVGGELGVDGRIADDYRDGTLEGGIPYRYSHRPSDDLLAESDCEWTGPLESGAACTLSARVQHTLKNQLKSTPYRNIQGDSIKSTQRFFDKAKQTNQVFVKDYMGQAHCDDQSKPIMRPFDKAKQTNQVFVKDYMGQAHADDQSKPIMRPFDKAKQTNQVFVKDYMGQAHSDDQSKPIMRPFDKAKTTATAFVKDYMGQAHADDQSKPIMRPFDKAKTTTTAFVKDYMGQAFSDDQSKAVMRPFDKTRPNMRDSTQCKDYMGISSARADHQKSKARPFDKARSNTRATTYVKDYLGGAGSVQTRKPRSYEDMYNATTSNNMEELLEGRTYGPNKASNIAAGACDVNIQIKDRTGYDITKYGSNPSRTYQAIPSIQNSFENTSTRDQRGRPGARQPEDFAVEQFKCNPYSQALDSSAPMTSTFKRGETPFEVPSCSTGERIGEQSTPIGECMGGGM